MNLIALLIGLVIERLATQLFHWRRMRWLDHIIDFGFRQVERLPNWPAIIPVILLAVVLGVPLAWVLARTRLPGRRLIRAVCTLSMVLPPVVAGVALFLALGRRGVLGRPLDDAFGVSLPFTTASVVIAQLFVAMPFLVITVELAQVTPPVGFNLFVLQALSGHPIERVAVSAFPFFLLLAFTAVLLVIFPQLALWLPEALY